MTALADLLRIPAWREDPAARTQRMADLARVQADRRARDKRIVEASVRAAAVQTRRATRAANAPSSARTGPVEYPCPDCGRPTITHGHERPGVMRRAGGKCWTCYNRDRRRAAGIKEHTGAVLTPCPTCGYPTRSAHQRAADFPGTRPRRGGQCSRCAHAAARAAA